MKALMIVILFFSSPVCFSQVDAIQAEGTFDVVIDKNHVKNSTKNRLENRLDQIENQKKEVVELNDTLTLIRIKNASAEEKNNLVKLTNKATLNVLDKNVSKSLLDIAGESALPSSQATTLNTMRSVLGNHFTIMKIAAPLRVSYAMQVGYNLQDGSPQNSSFVLPIGIDSAITVEKTNFTTDGGLTIWSGQVKDNLGDVMLVSEGSDIRGFIKRDSIIHNIYPLGDGFHAVATTKDNFPSDHAVQSAAPPVDISNIPFNDSDPIRDWDNVEIKVLVAYTQAVASRYPRNIKRDLVDLAIITTNRIFADSKISNLRLIVTEAVKVSYQEQGGMQDHLDRLVTKDEVMDNLLELRNTTNSDIVVLIVNDNSACGEARMFRADIDNAFAVVHYECASENYSFAHEIGHLFGCRHNREIDDKEFPYPYGHGYISPQLKNARDVMSGYEKGKRRYGVFSSPMVFIKSYPFGSVDFEDNARVIRNYAKTIASFKP